MSVYRMWFLTCDGADGVCGEELGPQPNEPAGATRLRARAKAEGWTRRGAQDFCPTHSGGSA